MQKKNIKAVPDLVVLLAMIAAGLIILSLDTELYLKFILLLLCLSSGYVYQIWDKEAKERFLLESRNEAKRIALLMAKAARMDRVSFSPDKAQQDAKLAASFFEGLMDSEGWVIWVKKEKEYQALLGHKIPQDLCRTFRKSDRFVSRIKSLESPVRIEALAQDTQKGGKGLRLTRSLEHFIEKTGCNWVFPLGHKNEFLGFILLNSPRDHVNNIENRLLTVVCDLLWIGLKNRKFKEKVEGVESQLRGRSTEGKKGEDDLNQTLKKRLFDLYSLFQATEAIYNIKNRERLFFNFTSIVQKQMDSKWVVIFLPEEESKDLVAESFKGIELGAFQAVKIKKESQLRSWVADRANPFRFYDLDKSLKKERITTLLSGLGVQLVCRLILPDGDFGIVLLGEKTEGIRYDSTDLANLGVLTNMATLTLKNIEQFKIIEELSYTDSMTGLYNYRYFYKRLNEEIFRAKRFGRKISLVMFDIDDFKMYNDSFGHQAGDAVLKQLGKFILEVVRSIDVVSRYGGEEFCVIMPEADDRECTRFMERLRKSITDFPFKDEYLGHEHHIAVSVGAAVYPRDAIDADRLIYCADMALLRAKSEGKNKSVMFRGEKFVLKPSP